MTASEMNAALLTAPLPAKGSSMDSDLSSRKMKRVGSVRLISVIWTPVLKPVHRSFSFVGRVRDKNPQTTSGCYQGQHLTRHRAPFKAPDQTSKLCRRCRSQHGSQRALRKTLCPERGDPAVSGNSVRRFALNQPSLPKRKAACRERDIVIDIFTVSDVYPSSRRRGKRDQQD
jgi:hypothetical protein